MIPFSVLLFLAHNLLIPLPDSLPKGGDGGSGGEGAMMSLPYFNVMLLGAEQKAAVTVQGWNVGESSNLYFVANIDGASQTLPNGVNGEFGMKTLLAGPDILKVSNLWPISGQSYMQSHTPPFNTFALFQYRYNNGYGKRFQYVLTFNAYYTIDYQTNIHSGEVPSAIYIY
jgi:hypothetical protein